MIIIEHDASILLRLRIFISITAAIKLDKMAVVHKYRNIERNAGWLSIQGATSLLPRCPNVYINRRCEHSKEYLSKRNGSQPRKFSFDLAFKNTRINIYRLGRTRWVWCSKYALHDRTNGEKSTRKLHSCFTYMHAHNFARSYIYFIILTHVCEIHSCTKKNLDFFLEIIVQIYN